MCIYYFRKKFDAANLHKVLKIVCKHTFFYLKIMNTTRLSLLQAYYEEDPSDPFNAYALAMEYLDNEPIKSLTFFKELLDKHPTYLPTYYHAAELFANADMRVQAAEVYQNGIALALEQKQAKSLQELKNAYQNFLLEE